MDGKHLKLIVTCGPLRDDCNEFVFSTKRKTATEEAPPCQTACPRRPWAGPLSDGGAGVEGGPAIVSARPRGRAPRRPVCGRRCEGWRRAAGARPTSRRPRCHPGYAPLRAGRPEHGAGAEAVPWARSAASGFAPASGGADVSAARGHGRAQADALPGLPAEGQGKGIEVAADGGARRTREGRVARGAGPTARRRCGRPGRGERPPADRARLVRGPGSRRPRGPRTSRRGRGRRSPARAGGDGAVARPPARGGAAHGVPRRRRRRGGRARPPARAGAAAAGRPRSRGCRARRGESGRASRARPGSGSQTPAPKRRATRPGSRPGGATGPTTPTTPWPS